MTSATFAPSTVLRFASSLPLVRFDFSRFTRTSVIEDDLLRCAYKKFAKAYGNRVDSRFDEHFLAETGRPIIDDYTVGVVDRQTAAVALAVAWDAERKPVGSLERKTRIADVAMAADTLLRWYDDELSGEVAEFERQVGELVVSDTSVVTDATGRLTLTVTCKEGEPEAAHMVADGLLDHLSYDTFVQQAQRLHREGIRKLTIDLGDVREVSLSGVYALHATAKLFAGESYPSCEFGLAGLRHMAEENLAAGIHKHVRLVDVHASTLKVLEQSGLIAVLMI